MPLRLKRDILIPLLFMGVAALMSQCTKVGAPVQTKNGLICQSVTTYLDQGLTITKGSDCKYTCPDGRLLSLPEAVESQSQDELNFFFCGVPLPTPTAIAQPDNSQQVFPLQPTLVPLLTNVVYSCNPALGFISFPLVDPHPDLAGKKLDVQIQGQSAQCSVDPASPNMLLCKLPPNVSFPAGVVVRLDGTLVNYFPYDGKACATRLLRVRATDAPGSLPPTVRPTLPPPTKPGPTNPPPTNPPPTSAPPTNAPPTDNPPPTDPAPTDRPPLPTLPIPLPTLPIP